MEEIYLQNTDGLTDDQIREGLRGLLTQYPALNRVLVIPPDYTRCYSYGGRITQMLYQELTGRGVRTFIMPAIGTHMPVSGQERIAFFGEQIPKERYLVHHWQTDTVKLGEVPAGLVRQISGGKYEKPIEVELDRRLTEGAFDLILSVGQVVPHEVVGMANYSKNIFVGCGGREMINRSHFLGAVCGIENALGVTDSPVRQVYDYAQEHFVDGKIPIVYILTVTEVYSEQVKVDGCLIGSSRRAFEKAAALSSERNIVHERRRARKVVAYLNPDELKTTWVGNKGIYRSRMLVADGGELILLAPGVRAFGENEEMDAMTRRYGYTGTDHILKLYEEGAFEGKEMSAAHLIHGSSEGRFTITYATRPENLSRQEIESVGYQWMDYNQAAARYDPKRLAEGWNRMPDGEEIYFIGTPAAGLWKCG